MKTYIAITYLTHGPNYSTESHAHFIRHASFRRPSDRGAARMVAAKLNAENDGDYAPVRPSDVSICRIELCGYVTR
jgi:hypothetical protein